MNYYRKFIEGFSRIAAPLTNLTKKETDFQFRRREEEAFKELKRRLTSAPILTIFNLEKKALLEIDTSDEAIGVYLT
jgi:hypothetical protein